MLITNLAYLTQETEGLYPVTPKLTQSGIGSTDCRFQQYTDDDRDQPSNVLFEALRKRFNLTRKLFYTASSRVGFYDAPDFYKSNLIVNALPPAASAARGPVADPRIRGFCELMVASPITFTVECISTASVVYWTKGYVFDFGSCDTFGRAAFAQWLRASTLKQVIQDSNLAMSGYAKEVLIKRNKTTRRTPRGEC
ncbi:hypothetical protein EVAR_52792_1 [Eumeta japonica]|uniref:Uncharacterized protein n=1 Tax=Eumeta variegata TaxID=151549 RepID=A0A4C1Z8R5_EUMVA|nr:hypothetical protein EVAR_52792_1 [Eumeta japonica]